MNFELLKETLETLQKEVENKRTTERNNSINNLEEVCMEFKHYRKELVEMANICFMRTLRLVNGNNEYYSVDINSNGTVGIWVNDYRSTEYKIVYKDDGIWLVKMYDKSVSHLINDLNKDIIDKLYRTLVFVMDNWNVVEKHFKDSYIKKVNELMEELKED